MADRMIGKVQVPSFVEESLHRAWLAPALLASAVMSLDQNGRRRDQADDEIVLRSGLQSSTQVDLDTTDLKNLNQPTHAAAASMLLWAEDWELDARSNTIMTWHLR